MTPLTSWDLFTVWEQGYGLPLAHRVLLLLFRAWPDVPEEDLARLSIGQRDGRLLLLRKQLFGSQLQSMVTCPKCQEKLELTFKVDDIYLNQPDMNQAILTLELDDTSIRFRLPNSLDLLTVDHHADNRNQQQHFLTRCLLMNDEEELETEIELSARMVDQIAEKMAEVDPQADIQFALDCLSCQHSWQILFDIASFIWQEINNWALRTVRDVHALAAAYGWQEKVILEMSPWRRQLYLQMVNG